jgi:RNA polymerase sigma-70 factor (ECF subfamily)
VDDAALNSLLIDLHAGKPDAADRLLNLVQSTVFSFGMKVCGGKPEDARDTMQDTLLKVYQSLPELEFQNSRALKVWLYKVAKNACLMMRRRGKFEPDHKMPLEQITSFPDWSTLPLNRLIQSEMKDMVQKAIQSLPYDHRLVLVLRDIEELSTKETSEILGISNDVVKIRLHRARSGLRKILQS